MNASPMHAPPARRELPRALRPRPRNPRPRSALFALAAVARMALEAPAAHADAATDAATAKDLTKPAERRSGLVFGFDIAAGIAGSSGYPNNSSKIGVPAYYDSSDAMGGGGFALFALGSLTDWLSFGAFYSRSNFRSGTWSTFGGGGGFRVDAFPLFRLYPPLKDLGVYGQFGVGTATLVSNGGEREPASGTESLLCGGVFYEFFLGKAGGGHFAAGPSFEYDAVITQANERHSALLGGRLAFYTGR